MSKTAIAYLIVAGSVVFAWVSLFVLRKHIRAGFVSGLVTLTAFGITGMLGVSMASRPPGQASPLVGVAALVFLAVAFGSLVFTVWRRLAAQRHASND